MPEVVEVIIRAGFETKGLPEETVKRATKRRSEVKSLLKFWIAH